MYILLDTDRNCAPLLLTGETPHDKQEAIVLTTTKISSCVWQGLNAKTDWLMVSYKVTQTLTRASDYMYRCDNDPFYWIVLLD